MLVQLSLGPCLWVMTHLSKPITSHADLQFWHKSCLFVWKIQLLQAWYLMYCPPSSPWGSGPVFCSQTSKWFNSARPGLCSLSADRHAVPCAQDLGCAYFPLILLALYGLLSLWLTPHLCISQIPPSASQSVLLPPRAGLLLIANVKAYLDSTFPYCRLCCGPSENGLGKWNLIYTELFTGSQCR
jgi:hypothetical protein